MCDKDKLLVCSVIPGQLYLTEDQQVWRYHAGVVREGECCDVCHEPIGGSCYIGDDTKVHKDCIEVVVPMSLFGGYEDNLKHLAERNVVRMTEVIDCQPCAYQGYHIKAVALIPTYPFDAPGVLVYLPLCQACYDKKDEFTYDLCNIQIIYPKEAK